MGNIYHTSVKALFQASKCLENQCLNLDLEITAFQTLWYPKTRQNKCQMLNLLFRFYSFFYTF